ncbi:MAG: hypothetical protein ACK6DX_15615 [Acidobacteriota bacterium]
MWRAGTAFRALRFCLVPAWRWRIAHLKALKLGGIEVALLEGLAVREAELGLLGESGPAVLVEGARSFEGG